MEDGTLVDRRLIENLAFDSAGRLTQIRITTYDADGNVTEMQMIYNNAFDALGNVTTETITAYCGTGEVMWHKVIVWDGYGWDYQSSPKQVVYDFDDNGVLVSITETLELAHDEDGRLTELKVTRWDGSGNFIEMQMIENVFFDEYARVTEQIIATYDEAGTLLDLKVIVNNYNDNDDRIVPNGDSVYYDNVAASSQEPQLQDPQVEPASDPVTNSASDVTSTVVEEIISKQAAIGASHAQLSGGKFQRKSLMEEDEPVQLRWNRK